LEVKVSVLDLDKVQKAQNRVFPDSATLAAIQTILEHPQIVDSWNSATEKVIALRKAHLDEIASTVTLPVDDTTDLSVQIRRLICWPWYAWSESSRQFLVRLLVAATSVSVTAPAFTGDMKAFDEILVKFINVSPTHLYPVIQAAASGNLSQIANWSSGKNETVASGYSSGTAWSSVRDDLITNHTLTGIAASDTAGYSDFMADGSSISIANEGYGISAVTAALQNLIGAYAANPGSSPYSGATVTIPSLITDILGFYATVYDFLRNEVETYTGQSYKFISDTDYTTLQDAYTSLV
jgi:hypothetical protein